MKYPKIDSIFKRDERGRFFDEYSRPEFGILANNQWEFTEKLEGMNMRVWYTTAYDADSMTFLGRTDNAQIPGPLLQVMGNEIFSIGKMSDVFSSDAILFGEGVGPRIQKGKHGFTEYDFILFDVYVFDANGGGCWLKRESVVDIANDLSLAIAPNMGYGNLADAIGIAERGFNSHFGNFAAEGLVLRPVGDFLDRFGQRIITKVKTSDFNA